MADEAAAVRNIRRALRHFDRALAVRTRRERPLDHAITQFNRGEAYLLLAALDTAAALASAEACFQEAEECFRACGRPDYAAQARDRAQRTRIGSAGTPGQ